MVFTCTVRAVAWQSAKGRVPSIKFRKGAPSAGHSSTSTSAAPQQAAQAQPAVVYIQELPNRFKRQPISQEECDYINRGGPA